MSLASAERRRKSRAHLAQGRHAKYGPPEKGPATLLDPAEHVRQRRLERRRLVQARQAAMENWWFSLTPEQRDLAVKNAARLKAEGIEGATPAQLLAPPAGCLTGVSAAAGNAPQAQPEAQGATQEPPGMPAPCQPPADAPEAP